MMFDTGNACGAAARALLGIVNAGGTPVIAEQSRHLKNERKKRE
jgi:hypothetical protein